MTTRENETAGSAAHPASLQRTVGLRGAVVLGLGSMVGTGVFVSLAIGAELVGLWVLPAILLAACVAMCNGLSSAQLAAKHPVSGGSYEYGYRELHPVLGFLAGEMFLIAKSASAATAVLAVGKGIVSLFDSGGNSDPIPPAMISAVALFLVTGFVLAGLRRSQRLNTLIVVFTLSILGLLSATMLYVGVMNPPGPSAFLVSSVSIHGLTGYPRPTSWSDALGLNAEFRWRDFLNVSALIFVAFTGYGRVATMGEEIQDPRRSIPRAVVVTILVTAVLYLLVASAPLVSIGVPVMEQIGLRDGNPLQSYATLRLGMWAGVLIAVAAVVAMLGVLLNLILGLSRVVLAMARRNDMPSVFASITDSTSTPTPAVILVAMIVGGIALTGSIYQTWSLSAASVLLYYGIANLAALQLNPEDRFCPPFVSVVGLVACLLLMTQVDYTARVSTLVMLIVGLLWHVSMQRYHSNPAAAEDHETHDT